MTPFVVEEIRKKITDLGFGVSDAVGDLCFIFYKEMMRRWNESPRWTTIHSLKKEFVRGSHMSPYIHGVVKELSDNGKLLNAASFDTPVLGKFDIEDVLTASELAFDVFMAFHGIEYEKKKREENGDIL